MILSPSGHCIIDVEKLKAEDVNNNWYDLVFEGKYKELQSSNGTPAGKEDDNNNNEDNRPSIQVRSYLSCFPVSSSFYPSYLSLID